MFVNPNIRIYAFVTPFHWLNHKFAFSIWDCLSLWKYVHFCEFSDNISDIMGHLSFAFWLTSRCVIICRLVCGAANGTVLFFSWLTFHSVHIPLRLCPFIGLWTCFLASMSWLFKYCCSAQLPASVFPILVVLGYRPRRCPAGSYGSSIFTF